MNPNQVARNRTARLVREGAHRDRVAYTSETPKREHVTMVEVESGMGRYWRSMPDNEVDDFIDNLASSYEVSDIDHSAKCWCQS